MTFWRSIAVCSRWSSRHATAMTITGYPSTPSRSATWDRAYASFKRGDQLAMPHFDPRPTDAEKQARLTAAYQAYRNGALAAEDLPDLADIFPDDPQTRAEIGLETEPGATPA